jgi:tetratricopeptide (TPR) repeat protein
MSPIPWFKWRLRLAAGLAVVCLCLLWLGRGRRGPSPEVEKARVSLQVNEPQVAYDKLVADESAEAHYLRAVALNRLKQRKAAHEQIRKALDQEPDNPKYQGFEWLIDLLEGTPGAADKIIALYDRNRSSGAIALFATLAYLTKKDVKSSVAAFNGALTMSADAPEHMFEMLNHALNTGRTSDAQHLFERLEQLRPDDVGFLKEMLQLATRRQVAKAAESLLARLETLAPNDVELEKLRVEVLLLTDHKEEAVQAAGRIYRRNSQDLQAAESYAQALAQAKPTPERDQVFVDLTKAFPKSIEILAKYALYLTRSDRLPEALTLLNGALRQTLVPSGRSYLMQAAIILPLDAGNPERAEEQVKRHRRELRDPNLVTYYEGRILALRKDYDGALGKFRQVLDAEKKPGTVNQALLLDTRIHLQRVFAEKTLAAQIQHEPSENEAKREKRRAASAPGDTETSLKTEPSAASPKAEVVPPSTPEKTSQ